MASLQDWFNQRMTGDFLCLSKEVSATEEWRRSTGRPHYAKLTLRAEPAHSFEMLSEPDAWKDNASREEFEPYVLDGVVSVLLLQHSGAPVLGVRIFITATSVDELASNGNAFFMAAKAATAKLLQGPQGEYLGNCAPSDA